jgi:hypothetical protein
MSYDCKMTKGDGTVIKYFGNSGDYMVITKDGVVIKSGHVYDPLDDDVRGYLDEMGVDVW